MTTISLISSSPPPLSHQPCISQVQLLKKPKRLSLRKPIQEKHVPICSLLSSSSESNSENEQETLQQNNTIQQETVHNPQDSFQGLHSLDANRLLQYQNQFGDGSLKSSSNSSHKYAFKQKRNTKFKRKRRMKSLKSKMNPDSSIASSSKQPSFNHYSNHDPGFKDKDLSMQWEGWNGIKY